MNPCKPVTLLPAKAPHLMEPLSCTKKHEDFFLAGDLWGNILSSLLSPLAQTTSIQARSDFFPGKSLLAELTQIEGDFTLLFGGELVLARGNGGKNIEADGFSDSFLLQYPWDLLRANEILMKEIKEDIRGEVRNNVTIDGPLILGENSTILPGVYMEGNIIIGKNCKIGPNCYLRGSTAIGDNCHIGQAVEVKNSILMDHVAAGHLTYIGDSIIGSHTNFGAGTIISNFRHDGKNHSSMVEGSLVDTGRRKFGAILGENVHTGIHTSIYPGRKIWPGASIRPGTIIQKDWKE